MILIRLLVDPQHEVKVILSDDSVVVDIWT
jgi:hypothetical protein